MEKISIVVPCYNEEDIIKMFYHSLIDTINKISDNYMYEIIFINDGSKDHTYKILKQIKKENKNVITINFSRNFGKEAAIYAGLSSSTGELVVLMDADLQHPPEIILKMLDEIKNGYDVVATKRKNRKR